MYDIVPDGYGNVNPGSGMSVSPETRFLPVHHVPLSARHLREGARGKEVNSIWQMGEGPFEASPVGPRLKLVPDPPCTGGVEHGEIGPAKTMKLDQYQSALADTQADWLLVHKGQM